MIFVDQVSAAIPVLLLLTRSQVLSTMYLHTHVLVDATARRASAVSLHGKCAKPFNHSSMAAQ